MLNKSKSYHSCKELEEFSVIWAVHGHNNEHNSSSGVYRLIFSSIDGNPIKTSFAFIEEKTYHIFIPSHAKRVMISENQYEIPQSQIIYAGLGEKVRFHQMRECLASILCSNLYNLIRWEFISGAKINPDISYLSTSLRQELQMSNEDREFFHAHLEFLTFDHYFSMAEQHD